MSEPRSPLKLAVLISGSGTTLHNLLEKIGAGKLSARVEVVISSTKHAGGLRYAEQAGIARHVVAPQRGEAAELFRDRVFGICRDANVDLVVMGGYLKHVLIPSDFEGRVMNIHPSLIPAFCGRGFFGQHVHASAIAYGVKVSGCTVHFVDNEYDHGPIILQRVVPVEHDDSPATLAARIFAEECEAYPAAIQCFAEGKLEITGRTVRIGR